MARPVGMTFSLVGITRRHDRRAGRMIATRKRGVDEERIERLVAGAMSVDAARPPAPFAARATERSWRERRDGSN